MSSVLPEPTLQYVQNRIARFDGNPRYYGAESAVRLVFNQWPQNTVEEQVLVKVVVLNRMYSTNIYDPYTVASHIVALKPDTRLKKGDPKLVDQLADVAFGTKRKYFYSFATKYCSWHQPDLFQIYDSYVDWLLWEYRKRFQFAPFRRYDLRDYPAFVGVVDALADRFGLKQLGRKAIDKFLWIEAVEQWQAMTGAPVAPPGANGE